MKPEEQEIHAQLARSATHKNAVDTRAQQIATVAEEAFKRLRRMLPALSQAIDDAKSEDDRADAQRKYLQARQHMHHCSQAWGLARIQSLHAQNL